MRTLIAAVALLALAACNHEPMPPEKLVAEMAKCKAHGLKAEVYRYAWDNMVARVQCVPKS